MDTYKYTLTVDVEVEAFDESDAWDAIQDTFGVGQSGSIKVKSCEWQEGHAK